MMRKRVFAVIFSLAALFGILFLGTRKEPASAVVVCVLDAGCSNPDVESKDYLPEREATAEEIEHGDLVCGILQEYAPKARLYMLRCLYDGIGVQDTECVAQAIYDAVDVYHADVVNISWTLNQPSEPLHDAIRYAYENGVTLVAAAGNLSLQTPLGSEVYPAAWEEVIGVGGVDVDENGTPVSSLWYLQSESVFVCADGSCGDQKGSSFATPRVSAWIADYLSTARNVSDVQVREQLKAAAEDEGEEGYDTTFGWGFLDVTK